MITEKKDFFERIVELIKEDKELHDAVVRMINAGVEEKEIRNKERNAKNIQVRKP